MFFFAIAFLAGDCLVQTAPMLPPLWPGLAVLTLGLCVTYALRRRLLLALLLGMAWAWPHLAWRMAHQLPADDIGMDAQVEGYVASLPDTNSAGVRFIFDVQQLVPLSAGEASASAIPKQIELSWYDLDEQSMPTPGERWRLCVRLRGPRGFANPGGQDYALRLLRNGVGATGYVRATRKRAGCNTRLADPHWRYSVLRMRAHIAAKIAATLPNSPVLGIVQGLAVGDTYRVAPEQWRAFSATGTTHLLAISGLHIGIVAGLVAWLGGLLAGRLPLQSRGVAVTDVQSIAGMTAAIGYSLLAGFSVPTQRTLVMLLVYFCARFLRRQLPVSQGLGIALAAVLLIDPFAPLAPGFWLSFGAVSAIFIATNGGLQRLPSWVEYLRAQAVVTIGLLPLLIGAFGNVSLVAPLVNLLAIPLFTLLVVPIVLAGTAVLMASDAVGGMILQIAEQILRIAWLALEWASTLPWATWHFPQLPTWIGIAVLLGCGSIIARGPLAFRLAGAMLCLPAVVWSPARPVAGQFEIAALDVGQGLSVVVSTATHTLVYDAGPSFRSGRDTGEMVVLPYLYSRGVRRLDMLVLSHGDNDHVGGAQSIRAGLPTQRVLVGPSVRIPGLSTYCALGTSWEWDGVYFSVLHPSDMSNPAPSENNSSCVVRVQGEYGSALLLGDIEREAEEQLIAQGSVTATDVVVVPHHGSATSSTEALTMLLKPKLAMVSTGHGNRWGFPKAAIVARWRASGATVLNTATSGAIEVCICGAKHGDELSIEQRPNAGASNLQISEYRSQRGTRALR